MGRCGNYLRESGENAIRSARGFVAGAFVSVPKRFPEDHSAGLSELRFQGRIQVMNPAFTAIVKKDGDWWIGWIEEVPGVNAQAETKDQLLASLREILGEALEFNRAEARSAAESGYTEELLAL
jgi:predicted RNase H-like HicB family nuclease